MQEELYRCTKCGEEKTVECFYLRSGGKVRFPCRSCSSRLASEWAQRNPDRARASKERNAEASRSSARKKYAKVKDDPDVREAARLRAATWRANNADRHRENARRWQQENVDRYREIMKFAARARRVDRTAEDVSYASMLCLDPCSYCGQPSTTMDHIVPIASSGANDWGNLTAACKDCNARKHTTSLLEFMRRTCEILDRSDAEPLLTGNI